MTSCSINLVFYSRKDSHASLISLSAANCLHYCRFTLALRYHFLLPIVSRQVVVSNLIFFTLLLLCQDCPRFFNLSIDASLFFAESVSTTQKVFHKMLSVINFCSSQQQYYLYLTHSLVSSLAIKIRILSSMYL